MTVAGWIILVMLTLAAPLIGLGLGLAATVALLRCGHALEEAWERSRPAGSTYEASSIAEVQLGRPFRNLPGLLLHARRRSFRVECVECVSGRRRQYTVLAKHAGAARMKAWAWGERPRAVHRIKI